MGDFMKMKTKNIAFLVPLLLAACASEVGGPELASTPDGSRHGEAISQNTAAQIANPDAPSAGSLSASGARAAIADRRYLTDKVEQPALPNTQNAVAE